MSVLPILRGTDLEGRMQEGNFTGVSARIARHGYDHLEGIVPFDRLDAAARAVAEGACA